MFGHNHNQNDVKLKMELNTERWSDVRQDDGNIADDENTTDERGTK